MSTARRRRIRAAIEEAAEEGTSRDLLTVLCADGSIAVELQLTDDQSARLDWYVAATKGMVAET
jgi:hypothetical protein